MEAYLFIYSRLERFDYRLIFAPAQTFLPDPTRTEFCSFAREIINTDNVSNGKINSTRWSLIRRGNKVLFGIGIYNDELGDCSSDLETRKVRGFFGYVFNYEKGMLPEEYFSLSFFQKIYSTYFMPLWHAGKKDEYKINSIIQQIDINLIESNIDTQLHLNTSSVSCKVLPESVAVDNAINSALKLDDAEIVLGLNDIKHVTTAQLLQFRNVSIIGNNTEQNVPVSQTNPIDTPIREGGLNNNKSKVIIERERTSTSNNSRFDKTVDRSKREQSDDEDLANLLYSLLRQCGINAKRIAKALARMCGLVVEEQPFIEPIQRPNNLEEPNLVPQDENPISHSETPSDAIDKDKTERRTRLDEIRRELSSSEVNSIAQQTNTANEQSETQNEDTPIDKLHQDMDNIEELKSFTSNKKHNFDIEDLN